MSASEERVKKRRVRKKHHCPSEMNNIDESGDEKRETDLERRKKHRDVAEHNVTFAEETPEENEEFPFLISEHRNGKRKKKGVKTGEDAVQGEESEPGMQVTDYYLPVPTSEGLMCEKKQKRKYSQAEFDEVDIGAQGPSERKKRKKKRESSAELYSACEAENDSLLSDAVGNEESPCTVRDMEGHVAKGKQFASADGNRELASGTAGKKNRREAKSGGELTNACLYSSMSDQQLETSEDVSSWEAETNVHLSTAGDQSCNPGSVRRRKKRKLGSAENFDSSKLSYSPVQIADNSAEAGFSKNHHEQEATYRDGPGTVLLNELDELSSENKDTDVTEWECSSPKKASGHMSKKRKGRLLHLSDSSDNFFFTPPRAYGSSPERVVHVNTPELPAPKDCVPTHSLHSLNEMKKDCALKSRNSSGKTLLSSAAAASVPASSSSRSWTQHEEEVNGSTPRRREDSTENWRPLPGESCGAGPGTAFYAPGERLLSPPDPQFLEYLNGTQGYPAIHYKTKPSPETIRLYEEEQGLSLEYGKYTAEEDSILLRNVHEIAAHYDIRYPYMIVGHCGDHNPEVQKEVQKLVKKYKLMRMLGRGLPCRTLHSAYMRARILLDPQNKPAKNGPTSKQKKQLERMYAQMGPKWTVMAQRLGLTAEQCRSTLRCDQDKKTFATGVWSKEEDDCLQQAIRKQTSGRSVKLSTIDWRKVSKCMGRRTAQQCRRRWTLMQLNPEVSSAKRKWSPYDTIHLIWRMHRLNPPRSSAVDWDELAEYFPWAQSASIPRYHWQSTVNKYLPPEERADFQSKVKNLYERVLPTFLNKYANGKTVSEIIKLSKSDTMPVHPRDDN